METLIRFHFEGEEYKVGVKVYNVDMIILPDGRVMKVWKWDRAWPPVPVTMEQVGFMRPGMYFDSQLLAEKVN